MEDRESGNLSRKPALDILVELHRGSVTGSLKLERAPLQKAVYFRDGQILFAASNDPKDQLASILVEEGKLGPDQMQVAQARVSPGNPLAKVLTELGYISQRELAEAARIKVEKILTDLYTWKEGTYQFATKSLPKGAIDLELSTSRLLFASIRRVQDRDWVLRQLGSLETVLTPTASLQQFLGETEPEPLAGEVLRLADGVKSVKQIGAVSSLGEFEVCKVLAAALVAGALSRGGAPAIPASDDAFSFPSAQENFSFPPPPKPSFGNETLGIPDPAPSSDSMSYDTIFQAAAVKSPPAEESERTVLDPAPARSGPPLRPAPPARESARGPAASELLIDEPEPATEAPGRNPPRPRNRRGGGDGGRNVSGIVKWLGVAALAGAAGFSVYYFVWPLVGGTRDTGATAGSEAGPTTSVPEGAPPSGNASAATPSSVTDAPVATTTSAPSDPRAGASVAGTPPITSSVAPRAGAASPPSATPTSKPPDPVASSPPSGAPKPPPTSTPRTGSGGDGRALLKSGNLAAAARAFQQEISSGSAEKFTLAIGLYCNEENAGRLVAGASGSSEIYVLPTLVEGRNCYRVIWGLYDSREAAERGIPSIPNGLRAGDVAAVAVSRFLR
jgi:hypothetical protein